MKLILQLTMAVALTTVLFTGCAEDNSSPVAAYDGSKFILASEPEGAQNVIAVRESSKDADRIVITGRIGGSLNPWVDGRAAFSIVDPSLLACSDDKADGEPCSCTTPWDYCCETDKLPTAMVLVTFVEPDGTVVKQGAQELFDIKELQTVVIEGTAKRDDSGNLTVLATGMFVRK